jgi:lipoic acid synthetase
MNKLRKPEWLKANRLGNENANIIRQHLAKYNLHTVCSSARCPNQGECFNRGTATFMILGEVCTRNCRFCAVDKNKTLLPPDPLEPSHIAELSKELKLKHIVVTTVTRDDLPDGGASQFVKVLDEIREKCPATVTTETLISDLEGNWDALKTIIAAKPTVLNHNVETIERLYPDVRPMANYHRSLELLQKVKEIDPSIITKSGLMVGLGETVEEVKVLLDDLYKHQVQIVTIGQYLQPSMAHIPVKEYVHPDIFEEYRKYGEELGFIFVESGPLVRSSYHAERIQQYITK